jgi:poly-gamma-glutamate capsule biosynthesis protein CapA/YwtB (metallophosphatase superfamily)
LKARVLFPVALGIALLIAACGDDDAPGTTDTAQPSAQSATETADQSPTSGPTATATEDGEITLIAGGDVMLGRSLGEGILQLGTPYPFEFVANILAAADIAFVNLEVPVSPGGEPAEKDFVFRAPPEAAVSLSKAGIDIVSLANNHAYDYGPEALLDTIDLVRAENIATVGAGRDKAEATEVIVLEIGGVRVAFLAYVSVPPDSGSGFNVEETQATETTPGVNWLDPERIPEDVELAQKVSDVVIVSMHTGTEYQDALTELQVEAAHAAIDAGSSLVIGAQPHVLQRIETYNGGLILYSLGNFVFDFDYVDYQHEGLPSSLSALVQIDLTRKGVTGCRIVPVVIAEEDGRPRPVEGADAQPVLDRLKRLSDGSCGLNDS